VALEFANKRTLRDGSVFAALHREVASSSPGSLSLVFRLRKTSFFSGRIRLWVYP
jgi:hypothetical protein